MDPRILIIYWHFPAPTPKLAQRKAIDWDWSWADVVTHSNRHNHSSRHQHHRSYTRHPYHKIYTLHPKPRIRKQLRLLHRLHHPRRETDNLSAHNSPHHHRRSNNPCPVPMITNSML